MRRVQTAAMRITKPYLIEEQWDDRRGAYQLLIHEDSGFVWDIGNEYYHDGYVNRLNADIASGAFAVPPQAMVVVPSFEDVNVETLKIAGFRDGGGRFVKSRIIDGDRELVCAFPPMKIGFNMGGPYPSNVLLLDPAEPEFKDWVNRLSAKMKDMIWSNPQTSKPRATNSDAFEWKDPIVVPSNPLHHEELRIKFNTGADGQISTPIETEEGMPKTINEIRGFDALRCIVAISVLRNNNVFSLSFKVQRAIWTPYKREQPTYDFPEAKRVRTEA